MTKPPEIELASIVLQWDLKTELGLRAQKLAREILGEHDPLEIASRKLYASILLELVEQDMPRLEDLKKSISSMNAEELREQIKRIREDRVIRKDTKKAKVTKAKEKDSASTTLMKLMAGMSEAERDQFLKELEA